MGAPSTKLPEDSAQAADAVAARTARLRRVDPFDLLERYGILVVWVAVIVLFSILRPSTFPTTINFETIFSTQAVLLVIQS